MKKGVDYIGVNCTFWCHDGKGNVLLHKRSKNSRDEQGRWDPGARSIEFGETFEDTVRREVMEEYGTEPLKIEYVTSRNVLREHDGVRTYWIKNVHWVLIDPATVRIAEPEKIDEIGWFTFDTLPTPLHSQVGDAVAILRKYLEN